MQKQQKRLNLNKVNRFAKRKTVRLYESRTVFRLSEGPEETCFV
jgi:hypothetical protein